MSGSPPQHRRWGRNRSVRLADFDYREHAAYHVTVCARRGTTPFTDPELATMVCETLFRLCDECGAYVGSYALIPNHLHMLLSPDRSGMSVVDLVRRIKGMTTNQNWDLGRSGQLWQPRFHDRVVRKSEGLSEVARCILQNPDRNGLSHDYRFRFVDTASA